jgi:hypothetical protein
MTKFTTGKELEKIVYDIIWDAERTLLIVIKHGYFSIRKLGLYILF